MKIRRETALAIGLIVAIPLIGSVMYAFTAPGLIDAGYEGTSSWSFLNEAIEQRRAVDTEQRDRQYFHWVGRTAATRLALTWIGLVLVWLGWRRRGDVRQLLIQFFQGEDGPRSIAVVRIAVFFVLFAFTDKMDLPLFSSLPAELQFPPTGLGPVLAAMPINESLAINLVMPFKIVCLAAMCGLFTRWTVPIATIAALYVFGIPQMYGKVNHCHHLIWFGAILSVSPCADVLSIDALIRRWRGRPVFNGASRSYALPMRFIWVLFSLVYFFPGFWKIWMGGVDWIFSDHLRNQMYHLWSTHEHWRPVIDPSGARWLWAMGGLSVIVFEIAVVVLILFRRTRVVACVSGLAFHVANALTLNILFAGLMWCYVALIDLDRLTSRVLPPRTPVRVRQTRRSSVILVTLVGLGLIIPNVAMGVLGNNNGWPFACYPRFSYPIFQPERDVIEFDLVLHDGHIVTDDLADVRQRFRTARWVGLVRSVLAEQDEKRREQCLRALSRLALADRDEAVAAIRYVKATYSTLPEDRGTPPIKRTILQEVVTELGSRSGTGPGGKQ